MIVGIVIAVCTAVVSFLVFQWQIGIINEWRRRYRLLEEDRNRTVSDLNHERLQHRLTKDEFK